MNSEEYMSLVLRTESRDHKAILERLTPPEAQRLLHGGMGAVTESGELLDALKKYIYYGKPLDKVNIKEEMGDLFWYLGILCDELSITFEEIWEVNIAKLAARYGEQFNEEGALHRDLDKERDILEE